MELKSISGSVIIRDNEIVEGYTGDRYVDGAAIDLKEGTLPLHVYNGGVCHRLVSLSSEFIGEEGMTAVGEYAAPGCIPSFKIYQA